MNDDPEKDAVFVEEYLRIEDQDDAAVIACRKAGIVEPTFPIAVTARRMMERSDIQIAITIARKGIKKRDVTEISKETILTDLEAIFHSAMLAKDHSACNANRKLIAQLTGHLTENVTVTHRHDVKLMSDDDLLKIASRAMKKIEDKMIDITPGIGHLSIDEGT